MMHRVRFISAAVLALAILPGTVAAQAPAALIPRSAAQRIEAALARDQQPDAKEAKSLAEAGAVLLDVRSQDEWNSGHAKGAVFLP